MYNYGIVASARAGEWGFVKDSVKLWWSDDKADGGALADVATAVGRNLITLNSPEDGSPWEGIAAWHFDPIDVRIHQEYQLFIDGAVPWNVPIRDYLQTPLPGPNFNRAVAPSPEYYGGLKLYEIVGNLMNDNPWLLLFFDQ